MPRYDRRDIWLNADLGAGMTYRHFDVNHKRNSSNNETPEVLRRHCFTSIMLSAFWYSVLIVLTLLVATTLATRPCSSCLPAAQILNTEIGAKLTLEYG